jgi:hypothetical protein
MLSSSKATAVGLTEEPIPGPLDRFTMCLNQPNEFVQDPRIEAVIIGDRDFWAKPQLGLEFSSFNVNMRRFSRIALVRKEEEPKAAATENSRQGSAPQNRPRLQTRVARLDLGAVVDLDPRAIDEPALAMDADAVRPG